ncbi:MAG: hypothetical protein C4326_08470 [Ignavibacteria bacterium]
MTSPQQKHEVYDACPHCGHELSPWRKILLSVDRALMCRHCWYRILLDRFEDRSKDDAKKTE